MKTRIEIDTHVEEYIDYNWMYMLGDDDEFVRITPENIGEAAKHYKVPAAFLEMLDDAMREMGNNIIGALMHDLEDVWEKTNK